MRHSKIKFAIFLMFLAVLMLAQPALAAEFITPNQTGNTTIAGDEVRRNVYTAGGNVTITSNISGDLVVAGGNVLVQGNVEQDLMAAGGTLVINGTIGSDARLAGGNITITGPVRGDVLVGGGNVTLAATAVISGDLIVGSGNVVVEAPVAGIVRIGGGTVNINSLIGGQVFVAAEDKLEFGPQARVAQKVEYKGRSEAVIHEDAQIAQIDFQMIERKGGSAAGIKFLGSLISVIALIIAGLLLLKFFRSKTTAVIDKGFDKPWTNLGVGLVFAIVLPIVCVILFATIIGFYTALIVLSWLVLMCLIVSILASIFLGALILRWMKKFTTLNWKVVVLGVIALGILKLIPFVGWVLCAVLWLIMFGATLRLLKSAMSTPAPNQP